MGKFLYKNYDHIKDFLTPEVISAGLKMSIFSNMDKYVRKYFRDPRLQKIMQYPLVFLGASPYNAPALYNLMSHVDFNQGVFYPEGGIYKLVEALVAIASKNGAELHTGSPVERILTEQGRVVGVIVNGRKVSADLVISDADITYTEKALLTKNEHDYSEKYWESRTLAPSALLMYLGANRTYDSLQHHNLLFSSDWCKNFAQIFDRPQFPDNPSLYVCAPGKTDPLVAPAGQENLFRLVPLPSGLDYTEADLERYADKILATMETEMSLPGLRENLVYKKLFCVKDFESRFNSYKGTGLGLAHTLRQTALLRPRNYSRRVKGLYYVGANVHPGIGLPVTLISAELLMQRLNT
jgi:phytoene desaturase